jgi:HEAT repeat protein
LAVVLSASFFLAGCRAEADLAQLERQIKAEDLAVRIAGAKVLEDLRPAGEVDRQRRIKLLIEAAGDEERSVRDIAFRALVKIGEPAITPALEKLAEIALSLRPQCSGDRRVLPTPRRWYVLANVLVMRGPEIIYRLMEERPRRRTGWFELTGYVVSCLGDESCSEPFLLYTNAADPLLRRDAIELLCPGEAAVPRLAELLSYDEDASVRAQAIEAISSLKGGKGAVPHLAELLLAHEDASLRVKAVEAMATLKSPEASGVVLWGLDSEDPELRWNCARALGKIGSPIGVGPLGKKLRGDPDAYVRRCAAEALGRIRDSSAKEPLKAALKDEDDQVRLAAKIALAKLGDEEMAEGVLRLVEGAVSRTSERDDPSIHSLIDATTEICDLDLRGSQRHRAVKALLALLADENFALRTAAFFSLGKMKAPEAVEPAIDLLIKMQGRGESTGLEYWAISVLEMIGSKRANDVLAGVLSGDIKTEEHCRLLAPGALASVAGTEAVPSLVAALKDENFVVAAQAVHALAGIGEPRAIPVLEEASKSPVPLLKKAATGALKRLRAPKPK